VLFLWIFVTKYINFNLLNNDTTLIESVVRFFHIRRIRQLCYNLLLLIRIFKIKKRTGGILLCLKS
jgi:hypothetical protein